MRFTPPAAKRALKRFIYRPGRVRPGAANRIVRGFHKLYYNSSQRTWKDTFWLGIPTAKCPLDLWIYQEIIFETKPDIIIESGTSYGGSALYLASICDIVGKGRVMSIDVTRLDNRPQHQRIEYLLGSSTSKEIVARVKSAIKAESRIMVVLDSNHTKDHVLNELNIYGKLVTAGNYLIVEDTNVNGHPVFQLHGPGPMEALDVFMKNNPSFVADRQREKFFMTFNPKGYLRRAS